MQNNKAEQDSKYTRESIQIMKLLATEFHTVGKACETERYRLGLPGVSLNESVISYKKVSSDFSSIVLTLQGHALRLKVVSLALSSDSADPEVANDFRDSLQDLMHQSDMCKKEIEQLTEAVSKQTCASPEV